MVICGAELSWEAAIAIAGIIGITAVKAALELQVNLNENLQRVSNEVTSWLYYLSGWIHVSSNEAQKLFKIHARRALGR